MSNTKETYTRQELIELLEDFAFHFSDNGDPDTDATEWLNRREGIKE